MTARARMKLAWFVGSLAVGGIVVAAESVLLVALAPLPFAMGFLNPRRSYQALCRINGRTF